MLFTFILKTKSSLTTSKLIPTSKSSTIKRVGYSNSVMNKVILVSKANIRTFQFKMPKSKELV